MNRIGHFILNPSYVILKYSPCFRELSTVFTINLTPLIGNECPLQQSLEKDQFACHVMSCFGVSLGF